MMIHEIEPRRLNIAYKYISAQPEDMLLLYHKGMLLKKVCEEVEYPSYDEYKRLGGNGEPLYLFEIDNVRFFAVMDNELTAEGYEYCILREFRNMKPSWLAYAGALGHQIYSWMKQNKYCGCCGGLRRRDEKERALRCVSCGHVLYPLIPPSVIVGLTDGDRMLLTKYQPAHSPYQNYALVAGYVESGETPEQAVAREVYEEVGLRVKNIRYYTSQPWPFSGSLLLGYYCELDGDDTVTLEQDELREAVWVNREDIPDRSKDVSLTSAMIQAFRDNKI